ncbi:MAG TPA: M81 family metallopeptidase, partial [Myxococcota bacterium]
DRGPTETPESEIVRRVREVVGDDVAVAVSLDLHGLVTRGLVERSTILQGYQTNPHRDHAAVGARCARLLVDTALGRIAPVLAWRSLPMILGGGNTVDFLPPLRTVFQRMKRIEREAGVLGATVMTVHPWNRHDELGWSTIVMADANVDGARAVADDAAARLADACWAVRTKLPPTMATPQQAIDRARRNRLARRLGVVMLSDASDVVSAGAPGENTALLAQLIEARDLTSYGTLRDPEVTAQLHAQHKVGDVVDVEVGGKLDRQRSQPLRVQGTIERLARGHGIDRYAVIAVGSMKLVVVEGPAMAVKPSYYKDCGLDIWAADVVVVKNFFPFLLFFLPYMRDVIFVKTSGVTDFDAAFALPFTDPVTPRDDVVDWHATDARRRALRLPKITTTTTTTQTTTATTP